MKPAPKPSIECSAMLAPRMVGSELTTMPEVNAEESPMCRLIMMNESPTIAYQGRPREQAEQAGT